MPSKLLLFAKYFFYFEMSVNLLVNTTLHEAMSNIIQVINFKYNDLNTD